jgi:HSP20 family protein
MNADLKKWNSFKFFRRTKDAPAASDPSSNTGPTQWPPEWPDLARLFSRDPLQAMGEFFPEPRTGFSDIDRWFRDFSSSRFQPRVDVVDDGAVLRVTAELPGMNRGDLQTLCAEHKLRLVTPITGKAVNPSRKFVLA